MINLIIGILEKQVKYKKQKFGLMNMNKIIQFNKIINYKHNIF